jgi:hypothetical protein
MPGHDAFFGRGDCRADGPHLINKSMQHLPSQIWQTILSVVQRRDRGAHPARATSSDDAKLGEMTAQRIDQHRSLADQKVAHFVQHQNGLLVDGLDGDKTHRRPSYRLCDRLGIGGIGLAALHVWLDISWRHQSNRVPQPGQFPSPMMRGSASLHADKAAWQRSKEPQHLSSARLLAHQHLSRVVSAVNLEDVLREVQP